MGVTNSNKILSATQIDCGGTLSITLSLTAEPNIIENPADIVLMLDRSGSMENSLDSLKIAANSFIDIIEGATGEAGDGEIGGGSRIAIVSFSTTATQDTQLITSVTDLKAAVDALVADGSTNHEDAFLQGLELFDPASTNAKVMVMFTDGITTAGGDANTVANAAKALGVTIYAIGLMGNGGIDVQALNAWASDPNSSHVAIAPDEDALEDLFENLARNILVAGAENVVITDTVSPCFRITSLSSPTKGTATMLDANNLRWVIDELGTTQSEGASVTFTVEHVGTCSGEVEVNESVSYDDSTGNVVTFPSPTVQVNCDVVVQPEPCPTPVDISVSGCVDSIEFDAGDIVLGSSGQIVQLDVTLRNVCPGKRVALAIILNEVDSEYNEYKRGFKTMTIPAHDRENCTDITVRCVRFVLSESLDTTGEEPACAERLLRARLIANYIDNDFECCELLE